MPIDVTLEFGSDTSPGLFTGLAVATDAVDPAPVVRFEDMLMVLPDGSQTIERTWFASDLSGNVATGIQFIQLIDTTAPDLILPPDVLLEPGQETLPPATGVAFATDLADPAPVVDYVDLIIDGPEPGGSLIQRTWTARDASNNETTGVQTITVFLPHVPPPASVRGDFDGDLDVDRDDMSLLLPRRNQPAGVDDPMDLDGNGMIDALDSRILVGLCTRPRCSTI